MSRPARIDIDCTALRANAAYARSLAPDSRFMAVIKANAYGHGAVDVARALGNEADAFAVTCLEEAVELREAGIGLPILLLEGLFTRTELREAEHREVWIAITHEAQLSWLEETVLDAPVHCWLKVNTGMNRLGVATHEAPAFLQRLANCDSVAPDTVLFTHLACADNNRNRATPDQLQRFDSLQLPGLRSAANSAGVLLWPQSHYDWVRPGYMLYGNTPLPDDAADTAALRPAMTLRSEVISVRDIAAGEAVGYGGTFVARRPTTIASVAIGYGDGYPRTAANGTPVLVNGQRAALAGRVTMDIITVDVSGIADVGPGTEVILWGQELALNEVAAHAATVGYELITRLPPRVRREVSGL